MRSFSLNNRTFSKYRFLMSLVFLRRNGENGKERSGGAKKEKRTRRMRGGGRRRDQKKLRMFQKPLVPNAKIMRFLMIFLFLLEIFDLIIKFSSKNKLKRKQWKEY